MRRPCYSRFQWVVLGDDTPDIAARWWSRSSGKKDSNQMNSRDNRWKVKGEMHMYCIKHNSSHPMHTHGLPQRSTAAAFTPPACQCKFTSAVLNRAAARL